MMNEKNRDMLTGKQEKPTPKEIAEKILEKNLEDITIMLQAPDNSKSRIYNEVVDMVEKALLRISLRRTNQVKSAAAVYLGVNRNTLHQKIVKFGIDDEKE
jgi:Fis family transcriptional regulator, factor for inversion stimulation protein